MGRAGQEGSRGPCLASSTRLLPYTVIGSCLIYFHLWQEPPADVGAGAADEGHHAVAVHGAVALDAAPQAREDARRAAALAVAAVAAVAAAALAGADRDEERVAAALALLHGAVLVVRKLVLRARVPEPRGAPEAEDAALAVVAGEEWGARDAEQRLRGRERERLAGGDRTLTSAEQRLPPSPPGPSLHPVVTKHSGGYMSTAAQAPSLRTSGPTALTCTCLYAS